MMGLLMKLLNRFKRKYKTSNFIERWNEEPTDRERYWTKWFMWIIVMAFFCGFLVSANYYSYKSNEYTQEVIDGIVRQYAGKCTGWESPDQELQALFDKWNTGFENKSMVIKNS